MYKKSGVLTFYAETPVHMGTGQSVSYVDLPIQRERHTSFPVLWASGIKGVIRDLASRKWNDKDKVELIFGPESEGSEFASCISITDAKILLYPVRSLRGVFAWITCPLVLRRFKNDLASVGLDGGFRVYEVSSDSEALVGEDTLIIKEKNKVVLEEFVFDVRKEELGELEESLSNLLPNSELISNLKERIVIVSDNVFKDFVNYAVEIRTRIRIDQASGTVKEGALFTEELIPSESVFYSLVFVGEPFNKNGKINGAENVLNEVRSLFEKDEIIQLGGDETTGKGYMRVKFYSK